MNPTQSAPAPSPTAGASPAYVLYFRVSTKKQGESGLGLEAQRSYVNHYYTGKPILAEFVEVRSGKTILKRPQLQQAVALCKKQGATLVVAKIDRLSRKTEQALHLYNELEGRLESCDIPNLDKFTLTLFMAIADRERELIGLRTKQALDEKRKQIGEWRPKGASEKKTAACLLGAQAAHEQAHLNENSRRAMALIGSLRLAGQSYSHIAWQLNQAGFQTPRHCAFGAKQVQRLYDRLQGDLG